MTYFENFEPGKLFATLRHSRTELGILFFSILATTLVGLLVHMNSQPSFVARVSLSVPTAEEGYLYKVPLQDDEARLLGLTSFFAPENFVVTKSDLASFANGHMLTQNYFSQRVHDRNDSSDRHEFNVAPVAGSHNRWDISIRTTNPEDAEEILLSGIEVTNDAFARQISAKHKRFLEDQTISIDQALKTVRFEMDMIARRHSTQTENEIIEYEARLASVDELLKLLDVDAANDTSEAGLQPSMKATLFSIERARALVERANILARIEQLSSLRPPADPRLQVIKNLMNGAKSSYQQQTGMMLPWLDQPAFQIADTQIRWLQRSVVGPLGVILVVAGFILGCLIILIRRGMTRAGAART